MPQVRSGDDIRFPAIAAQLERHLLYRIGRSRPAMLNGTLKELSGSAWGIRTALLIDWAFVTRTFEVSARAPHDQAAKRILTIGWIDLNGTVRLLAV